MFKRKKIIDSRGTILLSILVFGTVATLFMTLGVAGYAVYEMRASNRIAARESAFHIAEAGANYYRWHLAHNPTDYTDGTVDNPGPYIHDYTDKDGNIVGSFSLEITAPPSGSSIVTVRSTGAAREFPEVTRTIEVQLGFPSFADNTFLTNANMNFGYTTVVHGTIHSNGGIRFDGTTDSWVRSAKDRYQYENQTHNGVWGGGGPTSFWEYPVPAVDFDAVTIDMATIKSEAEDAGIYLTSSGQEGWHLVFNGSNIAIYRVTGRECYHGEGRWRYNRWTGWYWDGTDYCFDIRTETFLENRQIPANGAIFVEDDVWVEGLVDGRVSVAAGRFPDAQPYRSIIINNNLQYAERGSDDTIGLLAQGDIVIPYEAPSTMVVDAAILSQHGKNYHPYYDDGLKDSLTIFGSQISYTSGGWKYVNGWGHVVTGYENTDHRYDGNLKFYPPPGFPTYGTYELLSWREIN